MRTAKTIAELVIRAPSSIPVLEKLGIDFRRNGQQDVDQACRNAGVTTGELIGLIDFEWKPQETARAGATGGSVPR